MFCAKCGNDVGDGAGGTCSRCGAPLPATGQAQPGQAQPRPAQTYPGQGQTGPAQQPGPGYPPPPGGGQYGAPPGGSQYAPPPPGQQYGAPPAGQQQYGAPPAGQQYGAPPAGQQQYGAPPAGQQQYGAPPGGQPYGAPAGQQPAAQGGWGGAPAPGQAPQGWSPGSRSDGPKFAFDAKRLTPGDITVGVASLVVLISLFLPWFNASVSGFGSGSESGMDQHGWLWLVFILVLGILGFLVLKAGFGDLPFTLPFQQEVILLAATGLNLLLVIIAFLLKPTIPAGLGSGVSIGWDVGAFLGLIAAIVAVAPLVPAARNLASGPHPEPGGGHSGGGQPR